MFPVWFRILVFYEILVSRVPGTFREPSSAGAEQAYIQSRLSYIQNTQNAPFLVFSTFLKQHPDSKSALIFFLGNIFTSGFFYRQGLDLKRSFLGVMCSGGPQEKI